MKKTITLAALAAAMAVAISCNAELTVPEQEQDAPAEESGLITLTVNSGPQEAITRTYITQSGTSYIPSWSAGDQLAYYVDNIPTTPTDAYPGWLGNASAGSTASFSGDVSISAGDHKLYGFASKSLGDIWSQANGDGNTVDLRLRSVQNPELTTFDSYADILVMSPKDISLGGDVTAYTVDDAKFARSVSLLKIVLKDAASADLSASPVTGITVTPSNLAANPLTGTVKLDLTDGYIKSVSEGRGVTAAYEEGDNFLVDAGGTNAAYLLVNPTTFAIGDGFTLTVAAGSWRAQKTITMTEATELPKGGIAVWTINLRDADMVEVPSQLTIQGSGAENTSWKLYQVTSGKYILHATALNNGSISFVDASSNNYFGNIDGRIVKGAGTTPVTATAAGTAVRLVMDFNTMTFSELPISGIYFFHQYKLNPVKELRYDGNGAFQANDVTVIFENAGWGTETRYAIWLSIGGDNYTWGANESWGSYGTQPDDATSYFSEMNEFEGQEQWRYSFKAPVSCSNGPFDVRVWFDNNGGGHFWHQLSNIDKP